MENIERTIESGNRPDLFPEIAGLLGALSFGEDGRENVIAYHRAFVEKFPAYASEYLYPWYCLFAAIASDMLRQAMGGDQFLGRYDAPQLNGMLNRALHTQRLFEEKLVPTRLSAEVIAFLAKAREVFVAKCWFVIAPKEYDDVSMKDVQKLRETLDAIREEDVNLEACRTIHLELSSVLVVGDYDFVGVVEHVMFVELGVAQPFLAANTSHAGHPDLFPEITELVKALSLEKDGLGDAAERRDALVEKLPAYAQEYLYPWYCLFAAIASDMLRQAVEGNRFFDRHDATQLSATLNRALHIQRLFEEKLVPTRLSAEVIAFLFKARKVFVELCWYVINPSKYGGTDDEQYEGSLWALLHAIPKDDKHHDDCWSIYGDLDLLLAMGKSDEFNMLDSIYRVELGEG